MYNKQLETFIKVADAGSFNKAAELLYITPSAVIKQINNLENHLNIQLFERTHRGLVLTSAGQSIYQDSKYMIQYSKNALNKAKKKENTIRIGYSPMNPIQLLTQMLPKIQALCPDIKYEIIPFENTPENAKEILKNLGKDIDVIVGIFDEELLKLRGCAGLELSKVPLCVAVSIHHPLASKDHLEIEDLYDYNLLMIHRAWSSSMDKLRDDLSQDIHIIDFDFYDTSIFNRCENTEDILLAISCWDNVHPLLKIIPVDWDYQIPFGILHAPHPSIAVKRFLNASKTSL